MTSDRYAPPAQPRAGGPEFMARSHSNSTRARLDLSFAKLVTPICPTQGPATIDAPYNVRTMTDSVTMTDQ